MRKRQDSLKSYLMSCTICLVDWRCLFSLFNYIKMFSACSHKNYPNIWQSKYLTIENQAIQITAYFYVAPLFLKDIEVLHKTT